MNSPAPGSADKTIISSGENEADSQVSHNSPSPPLATGDHLGKFEIQRQLGLGGMGMVYLAHDRDLKRPVAVKVLNDSSLGDASALSRFRAEAQSAGQLNHPNVVAVFEIGEVRGFPYIVMEFLPHGSLDDLLIKRSPLRVEDATRMIIAATRGLAAAHAEELIHRDIKPANLLVSKNHDIKITDFGLARARHRELNADLTQAGQILGTPYFMSPEQCQGAEVDPRSDLYSLGATYFKLLTGQSPFESAGSPMAILAAHLREPPPDPKVLNQSVPAPCVRIVRRLLAKSPDNRYPTADDLLIDLEAFLQILEDPNSASEIRYRGSVHVPRETFELPSEKKGAVSQITGVEHPPRRRNKPSAQEKNNKVSESRTWFSGLTRLRAGQNESIVEQAEVSRSLAVNPGVKQEDLTANRSSQPRQVVVNHKKEVFSGEHGRFVIWWPETISPNEINEVEGWLQMIGAKLRRIATGSED